MNSNFKNKQKRKNEIFNQKINSIKNNSIIKCSLDDKIDFYKKKILKNKRKIPQAFSQNSSQFLKFKFLNPNNMTNIKEQININKTNSNILNKSKNYFMNNLSFNKSNKYQRKIFKDKQKSSKIKSINTNNYIINTFNLSEKNYINNNTKPQKQLQSNLNEEIIMFRKENEELKERNQKHKKLIQKLMEDNKKLNDNINDIQEENAKLKQKIKIFKDNQDQLIMLIKIIQKNGVDIEYVIDKWNKEVGEEEENEEKNQDIASKSLFLDSSSELNEKIDCSSFIPITMKDQNNEKKLKVKGVPMLNFDAINNKTLKANLKDKIKNQQPNKNWN